MNIVSTHSHNLVVDEQNELIFNEKGQVLLSKVEGKYKITLVTC